MEAPTPRKSKRVPISLPAWLRALSTSCRLILDTMSKEDSDATGPRLDALGATGALPGCIAWNRECRPRTPAPLADPGRDFRYPSLCRRARRRQARSEEHTFELQSPC